MMQSPNLSISEKVPSAKNARFAHAASLSSRRVLITAGTLMSVSFAHLRCAAFKRSPSMPGTNASQPFAERIFCTAASLYGIRTSVRPSVCAVGLPKMRDARLPKPSAICGSCSRAGSRVIACNSLFTECLFRSTMYEISQWSGWVRLVQPGLSSSATSVIDCPRRRTRTSLKHPISSLLTFVNGSGVLDCSDTPVMAMVVAPSKQKKKNGKMRTLVTRHSRACPLCMFTLVPGSFSNSRMCSLPFARGRSTPCSSLCSPARS